MIGDELRRQANVFTHLAELGAAQILSSGNPRGNDRRHLPVLSIRLSDDLAKKGKHCCKEPSGAAEIRPPKAAALSTLSLVRAWKKPSYLPAQPSADPRPGASKTHIRFISEVGKRGCLYSKRIRILFPSARPSVTGIDASGRRKVEGKIDVAMELARHIDQMVLLSGDGDFSFPGRSYATSRHPRHGCLDAAIYASDLSWASHADRFGACGRRSSEASLCN